jgi:hypothetical protein
METTCQFNAAGMVGPEVKASLLVALAIAGDTSGREQARS